MTYAPATLTALQAYWVAHGGVNLGIVGNTAHTQGYHLGKDRIYDGAGPGVGDADYSVRLARDKAGLTNAASAADLGKLNGSLTELRKFSVWLVARCMSSVAIRHDFKEIIYSPDGVKVQRYDGPDNKIYTGPGNGDSSHLQHTHISYLRDSEARDKTFAFKPYFAVQPPVGGTMEQFITFAKPKQAAIPNNARLHTDPGLVNNNDPVNGDKIVSPGRIMPVSGKLANGTLIVGYIDTTPTETEVKTYFIAPAGITVTDVPTGTVPVPPDATSCKTFTDPLNGQITTLNGQVTALTTENENLKVQMTTAKADEKERVAVAAGGVTADQIRAL